MRSEEEQAEILREWWQKNGWTLLVAIILGVVALLGWRQWSASQESRAENASVVYERMHQAMQSAGAGENGEALAAAREQADRLVDEYPRTVYGAQARLALARMAVMEEDYAEAADQLRAVVERSPTPALEYTARIRLARVLLQQGEAEQALDQVQGSFPDAWLGQALELRGDALRALSRNEDARDAYGMALDSLPSGEFSRDRVQMKLDDMMPAS